MADGRTGKEMLQKKRAYDADDVNIRAAPRTIQPQFGKSFTRCSAIRKDQLDKLAVSGSESLGFQSAAGQAETLGTRVEAAWKKAQETAAFSRSFGRLIMQGLFLGLACLSLQGITSSIQTPTNLKSTITEASTAQEVQAKLNAILSATGETSASRRQVNDLATKCNA